MLLLLCLGILAVLPFVLVHYADEHLGDSDLLQVLLVVTGSLGVLLVIGVVFQFSTCFWDSSDECRDRDRNLLWLAVVWGIAWLACFGAFIQASWRENGE